MDQDAQEHTGALARQGTASQQLWLWLQLWLQLQPAPTCSSSTCPLLPLAPTQLTIDTHSHLSHTTTCQFRPEPSKTIPDRVRMVVPLSPDPRRPLYMRVEFNLATLDFKSRWPEGQLANVTFCGTRDPECLTPQRDSPGWYIHGSLTNLGTAFGNYSVTVSGGWLVNVICGDINSKAACSGRLSGWLLSWLRPPVCQFPACKIHP